MSQHSVPIKIDPLNRPRIPLVGAFPGDKVTFTVDGDGSASIYIPRGDEIFEGLEGKNELCLDPGQTSQSLTVLKKAVSRDLPHGALVVKYAIHCTQGGETYFAEGNSAPKIIIPRPPGW
jgi:hypothetical protein